MATGQTEQNAAESSERTIRAGGFEIGIIDEGGGVPLVLVHGGESDRTMFARLREYLGEGIRAISYDQRDSGLATNPPTPYTMDDLGDDLAALLDALGLERANVLGTSFGGAVAQHAAIRHPDRVDSLILIATLSSFKATKEVVDEMLRKNNGDLRGAVDDYFVTPAGRAKLGDKVAQTLVTRDPERNARRMAALETHEVVDRLGEISARTLVVHGTDDRIAPYTAAVDMKDRIPNAELRSIEGGRHAVTTEFADEIAVWVREFLGVDAS